MPSNETTIDLSDLLEVTNDWFVPLYRDETYILVLMGGQGSGKSWSVAQKIIFRCVTEDPFHAAIIRKVDRTHRSTTFTQLKEAARQMGVYKMFRFKVSPMEIEYIPNGNKIEFFGMFSDEDREKLKGVVKLTCMWFEEATELTRDDFIIASNRMRGPTDFYKQIILTFNPVSVRNWLKKMFWDDADKMPKGRVKVVTTTYLDNRFKDDMDIAQLEYMKATDPELFAIYGLAEWGVLTGLIYAPPTIIDELPEKFDEQIYSIDWGFNHPTAVTEHRLYDGESYDHELIYETGMTTRDTIARLTVLRVNVRRPFYCDSAEPDRIAEMRACGFNAIGAVKGPGSVKAGIDYCKTVKTYLTAESMNIREEYESYKWRVDRDGDPTDEPVKFKDHAMDGKRYGLWTHMGKRNEQNDEGKIVVHIPETDFGFGDELGDLDGGF